MHININTDELVHNQNTIKTFVVAKRVSAAAQHKDWQLMFARKIIRFRHVFRLFDFNHKARRPAQAHGCQTSNWDIFQNFHRLIIPFFPSFVRYGLQ